jgi:3-phenylpropionate/trans-cinnamate dioxygenase ferredoxin subunit
VARHVVGPLSELPPGTRRRVEIDGRAIAIFNVDGELYALRDVCPHQGAPLSAGVVCGELKAERPGEYRFESTRRHVKCPWHGWEYDLATGQSWYDPGPGGDRVRSFQVTVEPGRNVLPGPYVAETVPISVEDDYVLVELDERRST